MDHSDEPELECCIVCKKLFYSAAYSGGADLCNECFEKMHQQEPDNGEQRGGKMSPTGYSLEEVRAWQKEIAALKAEVERLKAKLEAAEVEKGGE